MGKQLFLRAKFQVVADMMVMFPETILSNGSFRYMGSSLTDKVLSFVCQPYGMYRVVKYFWHCKWSIMSGDYRPDLYDLDINERPSWKCWLARFIVIVRIVFLIPFWILHALSLLIDKINFMKIKDISSNDANNDDEDEWLGRALDTERRVKRIVDDMRDEMKKEINETNAEVAATNARLDATNAEISAMRAEINATNAEISASNVKLSASNVKL